MAYATEGIRSTQTDDGRIILDIQRGKMFSVNVVGSTILALLEDGWDEERIAGEISRVYETTIETVRPDVRDFIEELSKHRIVQAALSTDSTPRLTQK
jgi:hypothetical protein